ncbi:signal peptidase I [Nocardioides sp. cx-173]|uniref:signal peptidase I n=1 Tax=Nocardioides sp. cx-173 TaxID=2898796 RepID=UPI001E53BA6A|nr:signal peptidase I [Nocardioides sp. cx-173]MCD4524529.1 signal peptidase I [Nocardioides sp. cx-173]UGB42986.1 signal peptidase I [Nocardioides sp. cx-173]
MEIAPTPARRRRRSRARGWLLLAVLAPVTMLSLVPTMLGLQRYVVAQDSMSGGISRGSVVLERVVPVSDLEVGDVITYRPPPTADEKGLVTHRIVHIDGSHLRTKGDALEEPDPWLVPVENASLPHVVLAIPFVGYPFVGTVARETWLAVLLAPTSVLALLALRGAWRHRRADPAPSPGILQSRGPTATQPL